MVERVRISEPDESEVEAHLVVGLCAVKVVGRRLVQEVVRQGSAPNVDDADGEPGARLHLHVLEQGVVVVLVVRNAKETVGSENVHVEDPAHVRLRRRRVAEHELVDRDHVVQSRRRDGP